MSTILPAILPQMFHVKQCAEQPATHPVPTIPTTGGPSEAQTASLAAVTTTARAAEGRAN